LKWPPISQLSRSAKKHRSGGRSHEIKVPTSAGKLKAEPVTRKGRFGGRLLFPLEWPFPSGSVPAADALRAVETNAAFRATASQILIWWRQLTDRSGSEKAIHCSDRIPGIVSAS
jgi:hypothetical protein